MMTEQVIHHIKTTAKVPSFSTFEERLHPYIHSVFNDVSMAQEIDVKGNSLIYSLGNNPDRKTIGLTAHLDKINHYGFNYPEELPVEVTEEQIEGAMDDCAGLGIVLTIAEQWNQNDWPNLLFFFSEMEEKKGLEEHPELLKSNGDGFINGMGASRIAKSCIRNNIIPDEVITLDTTPLFEGSRGIALYSKHWELNDLEPSAELIEKTEKAVGRLISIDSRIRLDNNTNDYLHYGEIFNRSNNPVVSIALEPAIYPYHQKGERVFIDDIKRTLDILSGYLSSIKS